SSRLTAIFCVPVSAFAVLRPVSSSLFASFSWSPMAAWRVERTATVRAVSFRFMWCGLLGGGPPPIAVGAAQVVRSGGGAAAHQVGGLPELGGSALLDGVAEGARELCGEPVGEVDGAGGIPHGVKGGLPLARPGLRHGTGVLSLGVGYRGRRGGLRRGYGSGRRRCGVRLR